MWCKACGLCIDCHWIYGAQSESNQEKNERHVCLYLHTPLYNPWASYQLRKIAGCACARNAGNVFPTTDLKGKKLIVSDPGMHHGTTGSLTCGGGENVPGIPGIPGACTNRNFAYLVKGPRLTMFLQQIALQCFNISKPFWLAVKLSKFLEYVKIYYVCHIFFRRLGTCYKIKIDIGLETGSSFGANELR